MEEMMNNNMQIGFDEDTAPMNFDVDDLDSDQQTVTRWVIDESGSMEPNEEDVRFALEDLKQMTLTSKQVDEMILGKTLFGEVIKEEPYCLVQDFDTSYSTPGWYTKLYEVIVVSVRSLKAAVQKLRDAEYTARGILVILSDGRNNDNNYQNPVTKQQAADEIASLKDSGIDIYFIEFGPEAKGVALSLGIDPKYVLTPGSKAMSPEQRRKELRAAFRFVSKSAISISQGGAAPTVDNGMFSVD